MKNIKKSVVCLIALALISSSSPWTLLAQNVGPVEPINAQGSNIAGLSPASQAQFAANVASLAAQLSQLPSFSALPSSTNPDPLAAFTKEAVAFINDAASPGTENAFRIEAVQAVKGALLNAHGYGAQVVGALDQFPGDGKLAAEALSRITKHYPPDLGAHSATAKALADLRLDTAGSLDSLYDRLRALDARELKAGGVEALPTTHHHSGLLPSQSRKITATAGLLGDRDEIIGLIGVGKQGQRHLKTLVTHGVGVRAVDRVVSDDLRAQYDQSDSLRLEQADASAVFNDPRIRAVVIATPGNTHYQLAKQALLAGKHVLVEKPFTQTTDQALELVALAEERNLILMVGHNRFYLPHFQRLKTMIESGKLGKILSVEGNYLNPPQKFDRTHTALEGLGYHQFYMINALMNQDHPTKLVGAVSSEDKETVGLKLLYGDVPVTVKLDRNYGGHKTRNVIVVGSEFTATFDYGGEPASTRLDVRPTRPREYDEPDSTDHRLLDELQEQTVLKTRDEAEPSLDHQLRAFLDALHTRETPPSNGRMAISVVQTLESIRQALGNTGLYYFNPNLSIPLVTRLAREINGRIGERGGMVAIDGTAGVGKSTVIQALADIYELMYPTNRSIINNLDELRLPLKECLALKKRILGDELTAEEEQILKEHSWEKVQPGQPFVDEEVLWRNEIIAMELKQMRKIFDLFPPNPHITITRQNAYVSRDSKRFLADKRYHYRPGDVIFIDGKSANRESFAGYMDFRIRLSDALDAVRQRFERDRGSFLNPQELARHMTYYAKAILPSWLSYEQRTRASIHIEVDLKDNELRRLQ